MKNLYIAFVARVAAPAQSKPLILPLRGQLLYGVVEASAPERITIRGDPPISQDDPPSGWSPDVLFLFDHVVLECDLKEALKAGTTSPAARNVRGVAFELVALTQKRAEGWPLRTHDGCVFLDLRIRNLIGSDDLEQEASEASLIRLRAEVTCLPPAGGSTDLRTQLKGLIIGKSQPQTLDVESSADGPFGQLADTGGPSKLLKSRKMEAAGWTFNAAEVRFKAGPSPSGSFSRQIRVPHN